MISFIEDCQMDDALAFVSSEREIALAVVTAKLMDSDRNLEILRVLNNVFDSLECASGSIA